METPTMQFLAIITVAAAIFAGIIHHIVIVEQEGTSPIHTREGYNTLKTYNAVAALAVAAFPALYLIEPLTH